MHDEKLSPAADEDKAAPTETASAAEEAQPKEMAPAKSRGKLPIMRLLVSFLAGLAALAIFWGVYFLTRSTAVPEMANYAGDYVLASAESSNVTIDKGREADVLSLSLTADGKCRLYTAGKSYAGRWSLSGNTATIKCAGLTFSAAFSDGSLRLSNVFSDGLDINLDKVSANAEDKALPRRGTYKLSSLETIDSSYGEAAVSASGYGGCYIKIAADGSGEALLLDGAVQEISCSADHIIYKGMRLELSQSADKLILSYPGGITMTFGK